MKKVLCTILVLLMLPVWLFSCNKPKPGPGDDTDDSAKADDLLKDDRIVLARDGSPVYSVIRPDNGTNEVAVSAGSIIDAVKEKCGVELGITTDDDTPTEYEILVGDTNRPESNAAIEALKDNTFSVTVSGNKIVIAAKNDVMLRCAVSYFNENYIDTVPSVKGVFSVEKKLGHTSSSDYIVFDKSDAGKFMVTYPQSEKDYQVFSSYTGKNLYNLEYMANSIYTKLKDQNAGVVITSDRIIGTYKDEWREVLVGSTTRDATKSVKAELDFNEYAIKVVGNDIVITGLGYVTTKEATEKFLEILDVLHDSESPDSCYRIPTDFSYKTVASSFGQWPDAPEYTGGVLDSVTDAGDKSYVAVYTGTNKEEYNAYLASLESKGYSKYFQNDMNGNLYAIYKTDAVIINAYFIPYSSSVYIVAEDGYRTILPALESENVYTDRGLQSSVTQMKLNNVTDSNGQCYVFKLSDGRFIIVDGGGNDKGIDKKTKKLKSDAENLLNLLNELSGGEKPVIAAWFITHLHNDHYKVLLQFASDFQDKVTVESFVYNFPPDSMAIDEIQDTLTEVENAMNSFKNVKKIKAHTGQKYYIANAEIEMLFAPEMIYPNYITFYNDTSTVFSVTIGGTKTLITGDASPNTSKIMCNMYKEYLSCDILQIAHHGSYGCSVEYYEYTNPTKLAFLPVGITQQIRLTSQKENVFIKGLVPIIPHYQGTYTCNLPVKD